MNNLSYEEYVSLCYEKDKNENIHNATTENALLLFKKLLEKADKNKQDVRIVSGGLLASFYNELVEPLRRVINNGNHVQIITEYDINDIDNNNVYQIFKDKITDARVVFKELPNFIVIGNNAYRYEQDKTSHKAIANFNNPSTGGYLVKLFDQLKNDIGQTV